MRDIDKYIELFIQYQATQRIICNTILRNLDPYYGNNRFARKRRRYSWVFDTGILPARFLRNPPDHEQYPGVEAEDVPVDKSASLALPLGEFYTMLFTII